MGFPVLHFAGNQHCRNTHAAAEELECLCIALADGFSIEENGADGLVFRGIQSVIRMFYHVIVDVLDFLIVIHSAMYAGKRGFYVGFYSFFSLFGFRLRQGVAGGKCNFIDFLSQGVFGISIPIHVKNFGMIR